MTGHLHLQRHFNPRSHEGSDFANLLMTCGVLVFQSTLPRGERHHPHQFPSSGFGISIHAPTRGATAIGIDATETITFQSTLPRGERLYQPVSLCLCFKFQSTLPRGERLLILSSTPFMERFQSTLPRGERQPKSDNPCHHIRISIHAPTRGATSNNQETVQSIIFQSTLPRGERQD